MRPWQLGIGTALLALSFSCLDEGVDGDQDGASGGSAGAPGALDGFYVGRSLTRTYNSAARDYDYRWSKQRVFLRADGLAYYPGGEFYLVDNVDLDALAKKWPKDAGRWQVNRGKVKITFGGGGIWDGDYVSPSEFRLPNYEMARPLKAASRIDGAFYDSFFRVGNGNVTVSGDHWVTFRANGTIRIYDSWNSYVDGQSIGGETIVEGSYVIDGHTVTVTAKGDTTRYNLWIEAGTADVPTVITFNDRGYGRK